MMNWNQYCADGGGAEAFAALLSRNGLDLPLEEETARLKEPVVLGGKTVPNRICIQPMEGFDSGEDGAPTDFVRRRYRRFASSGAGLVWFEATAVAPDGRSNPRQMMLTGENVQKFAALVREMDGVCLEEHGYRQYKVLQLTHSGRSSADGGWQPKPVAARLRKDDPDPGILASDGQIEQLISETVESAVLAKEAGFDAADIKACHGCLLGELLSAYRRGGPFGGSFENRTKAMFRIIDGIREKLGDSLALTVRLNAYDSEPYPDGWGLKRDGGAPIFDPEEPVRLCEMLRGRGVVLIDISATQPDQLLFAEDPGESARPFAGAYDLLRAVKEIKNRVPGMPFVCTGLTSFGPFGPAVGAGGIRDGWFDLAGFGKQALAYPQFAGLALSGRPLDPGRCCILCGNCYKLIDPGHAPAGCVTRDPDPFASLYREKVLKRN